MALESEGKREGSLEAPTRHPLDWTSDGFYDETDLFQELERVFDIVVVVSACASHSLYCLTWLTNRRPWKSTVSTRKIT